MQLLALFTKAYGRILGPGLAALDPRLPSDITRRSPLARTWKQLTTQLDQFIAHGLAPHEWLKLDLTVNSIPAELA